MDAAATDGIQLMGAVHGGADLDVGLGAVDVELPGQFAGNASQGAPVIDAQWWKLYRDPRLDELVASALERNADIRTAIARVACSRKGSGQPASGRNDDPPDWTAQPAA